MSKNLEFKRMSRRSQMSFEYMILFTLALLMFIVIGTVLVSSIEKTRELDSGAKYLAKQIKSSVIIASMSQTDFQTNITLPVSIADRKVIVDIYKAPDNLVVVKEEGANPGSYNLVAREFLPIINPVGGNLENLNNKTIIIRKQGDDITMSLS